MRGRRRGRNRPFPPSPPSDGSTEASSSSGKGSVIVLKSSEPQPAEAERTRDAPTENEQPDVDARAHADDPASVDGATGVDADEDTSESGVGDTAASPSTEEPEAAARQVTTASAPPPVAVEAPVEVGAPEVSGAEVASDATGAGQPAAAAGLGEEESAAPAGRQPQAASGNPLPRVMAVANQKGGVGKTTTSVNLGAALAELGFRVLVIDLDPQGNATTGLGIDARNFELSMYDVLMRDSSLEDCVEPTSMKNLFVAPATIALAGAEIELVPAFSRELKLKRAIETVIDEFDYVLIDCPPSLGLITVNALAAADEVLVPIQCEYYALEGLSQLMRNVHLVASNLNPRLDISTIVLTMYDARTKLADQVASEVRNHFGNKVCRIVIPRTVRLSEAPSFGQPITAFDPASRGAIAYRELAKEVSGGTS